MINILLPERYEMDDKYISGLNIIYKSERDKEVDIGIYEDINTINLRVPIICLDISNTITINLIKEIDKIKEYIHMYMVKDIKQYEELAYLGRVEKNKIYIKHNEDSIYSLIDKLIDEYYLKNNLVKNFYTKHYWQEKYTEVNMETKLNKLIIDSKLPQVESKYFTYQQENLSRFPIKNKSYQIALSGECKGKVDCKLFVIFYSEGKKVDTYLIELNQNAVTLPEKKFDEFEVKIRIQGYGKVSIDKLLFNEVRDIREHLGLRKLDREKYLVLANAYPSSNQLYKNGFIHRRVKWYQEEGLDVDVYSMNKNQDLASYSYDGTEVYTGNGKGLLYLLRENNYRKILIHFPNEEMIEAIEESGLDPEMIIWIHGFGAERYTRRLFDYTEDELRENEGRLKERDTKQMKLMKKLYTSDKVSTVYVSQYILKVAEEDAQCKTTNPEIIPNIIDSELFSYRPKPKHQRNRILMIRPFVAPKYGCDIAINTILELSKRKCFEDMSIAIYGEGPLFDPLLKPLRQFKNIEIYERFLPQEEIARLHKKYGIMLLPTRHDTQGVSMGEAMSSGLVVATNKVWAIPEYIDDECGLLSENNDYITLANKIEELHYDSDKFVTLSVNAAKRVRNQCNIDNTIKKECELIKS